jgi:hypothetical protein
MTSTNEPSIAETVDPLVRKLFEIMGDRRIGCNTVGHRAGYESSTIRQWRRGRSGPQLFAFRDVLETIGYELKIVKQGEE